MDARGTPQRIVNAHPPDQRAQIRVDLRSTSKRAGFPPPVPAKAGPMPTDQGLGPNDGDGLEHQWKSSKQLDQEQAIPVREVDTTTPLPLQHDQLVSGAPSCLKSALRLERRGEQGNEKHNRAIIVADVRRFGHVINEDGVLGTHRVCVGADPLRRSAPVRIVPARSCLLPVNGNGQSRRALAPQPLIGRVELVWCNKTLRALTRIALHPMVPRSLPWDVPCRTENGPNRP
jgi:hypothetical protein